MANVTMSFLLTSGVRLTECDGGTGVWGGFTPGLVIISPECKDKKHIYSVI